MKNATTTKICLGEGDKSAQIQHTVDISRTQNSVFWES